MRDLTFREKLLYNELIAALVATGAFFASVAILSGKQYRVALALVFAWMAHFCYLNLGEIVVRNYASDLRTDERDREIEDRGIRVAYSWLSAGVLIILWNYYFYPERIGPSRITEMLFLAYMLSRIAKVVKQLRLHGGHDDTCWLSETILGFIFPGVRRRMRKRRIEALERLNQDVDL